MTQTIRDIIFKYRGGFITFAFLAVLEIVVRTTRFGAFDPLPICGVLVAYVSLARGLASGLASASVVTLYFFWRLSEPSNLLQFTPRRLDEFIILSVEMFAVAAVIGLSRRSLWRELGERFEKQLFESEKKLEVILQNIGDGITVQDKDGKLVYANQAAAKFMRMAGPKELLAVTAEQLTGLEIYAEDGRRLEISGLPGLLALLNKREHEQTIRFVHDHGVSWSSVKTTPILGKDSEVQMVINAFRDITNEREAAHNLAQAATREHEHAVLLDSILERAPIGFAFVSPGLKFIRINSVLAGAYGKEVKDLAGKSLSESAADFAASLEPLILETIATGQPIINFEFFSNGSAGGRKLQWLKSFYPVYTADKTLLGVGIFAYEITQQKEAEEEIRYRAYYDMLTRLPNRKSFEEQLMRTLHAAKGSGGKFAVMFLDLDRLKEINDTLGHVAGDEVLREMARRIAEILKRDQLVARWGGDEFVILIPQIRILQDVLNTAEQILRSLDPVMHIGSHNLHITASIGIAVFPADGEDIQTLQRSADMALYRAKDAGRNRYELYTPALNVHSAEKFSLEHDLRLALEEDQFRLYFQPILDLRYNVICGVEALLRWHHPRLGILSPKKFIPLAEEIGLIVPLGKWVMHQALTAAAAHQGQGMFMAVNVSPRQFEQEGFVDEVESLLQETGFNPGRLEIEITESLAMENLERNRRILRQIKDLGPAVTIDDFGIGYSSLNYLKRFPIDKLKIDKSFVRHCITNEQDTSIIKAIISMARSLNLKVVAEGVDSEPQLHLLRQLGCDAAQGFFISRPLSVSELDEFLNRKKPPEPEVGPELTDEEIDKKIGEIIVP